MIIVKPKLTHFISMVLVGLFFFSTGAAVWMQTGEFVTAVPILLLLGCMLSFWGIHILMNRNKFAMTIDSTGFRVYKNKVVLVIEAEKIKSVKSFANLRGRGVVFELLDGKTFEFDCRNYCSEKKLLNYCKQSNLPCA